MRRCATAVAALVLTWPVFWFGGGVAKAQERPGADGQAPSELRAFPTGNDPVGAFSPPASAAGPALPTFAGSNPSAAEQASTAPDPTREYMVTSAQGPWMVCVAYYSGEEAPMDAVRLVQELWTSYQMRAFIFNYGAEERRKELEHRKEVIRERLEYLRKMNVEPDPHMKIRVPHMHIEEQCAVLVGSFKDMESARRNLDAIKKLKAPDPQRVRIQHEMFIYDAKTGSGKKVPVNPFTQAFVVRNPSLPSERPANQGEMDLALLQKLNAGEPYSLLKCPKRFTLAITQLQMPTVVQSKETSSSFLESLGFGSRAVTHQDSAALSAHNLAEVLRNVHHREAYVLHTRFSSIVTVGSYDSAEDPRINHDIEELNRLLTSLTTLDRQQLVRLFPRPMPMAVPR
jgi:hypothetical protein